MQSPKDLNRLFAALREAKILVGPREVLRIQEVLARAESLDVNGLRSILVAILVKSREEKQRFEDIFRAFIQVQDELPTPNVPAPIAKTQSSDDPDELAPDKPEKKVQDPVRLSRRPMLFIAGAVAAAMGGAVIVNKYLGNEPTRLTDLASAGPSSSASAASLNRPRDAGVDAEPIIADSIQDAGVDSNRASDSDDGAFVALAITEPRVIADTRVFPTYVPRLDVEPQSFFTSWFGLIAGLGGLSMVLAGTAAYFARRRKVLPPRAPPPTRSGPEELPLSFPAPRDLELLDMQSEDALVWGIGRFVTDEVTTMLDIERSVAATVAAGGRPELRFERRGRHRQVCLWLDESARDPAIERLGREVSLALSRVGLDVEVSRFWAVPDKLVRQDGTIYSAMSVEEDLAFSIVAILTDGHALTTRHAGVDRRFGISRLMRMFARLPRLAFVDFGEGASRASRVARAYGITSVRPDEAAAFLALGRRPEIRDAPRHRLTGDATAWAAACAFGMHPVDEETAYEVRRVLGLSISPWNWAVIRRSGRIVGDWVDWPKTKRAELLDWLRRAEHGLEAGRVAPNSLLGKTISYWKNRLAAEALARKKNDAELPWIGTKAERALRIDRALLDLWDKPDVAVRSLYSFVGTDAEILVKEKLGDFAPLEASGTAGFIVLPWRFDGLSDASKAMFERLGFGPDAGVRQDKLDRDLVERRGRLWMGLGLACGLGIGAIAIGVKSWRAETFPCGVENVEGIGGWCGEVENWGGDGGRLVAGGLAGFSVQAQVGRTEQPMLRFSLKNVPCEETTPDGWFVQRCGSNVPPEKPERHGDPRRILFVLQGNAADERVRSLGKTLLERRVADVVLTKSQGAGALNEWLPLFDVERDKLVLVRMQDEAAMPEADNVALKFDRYVASLPSKTRMWTLPAKPRRVWSDNIGSLAVAFDAADRVFAVDRDGVIRQKKTPNFQPLGDQLPGFADLPENGETKWVSIRPDKETKVFVRSDDSVELSQGPFRTHLPIYGGKLIAPVVWNSYGSRFAGISSSRAVFWWNATETTPHEFPAGNDLVPNALAWSLNGNEVFVGTSQGVSMLADGQDPISFFATNQPISSIIGPIASKYLLTSTTAGLVYIMRSNQIAQGPPSLEPIREIRALTGSLSPDGNYIATVHEGGKIRVATTNDDILVDEFACDTTIAPAWSPDAKRLLVACGNSIFDRATFPPIFNLKNVDGVCASQENLEKTFGLRTAEATFINERCRYQ